MSASLLWLLIGAVFLAVEAFGIPGIGFLFAGLGAALVALMIQMQLLAEDNITWQLAAFFVNSSVLAFLLWRRLKHWRTRHSDAPYSNMVGTEATVIGTLKENEIGQVRWSGTIMRAKLTGIATLPEGSLVTIREVNGNVVTVAAK